MTEIGIAGVGVIGPGIGGWHDAVAVLTDPERFDVGAPIPTDLCSGLSANQRRRITPLNRMVLQCCQTTLSDCSVIHPKMRSVFSSSCGDLLTADRILRALTLPDKTVSPTQFHNSVHNTAAGYWSITRADNSGSTSVSAHDSSFGAGLLDAVSCVRTHGGPVLLVAYDYTAPPTLHEFRPYLAPFAVGLVLIDAPAPWMISVSLQEARVCDTLSAPALEAMRLGNPAARSLPLLDRIAANQIGEIKLPYLSNLAIVVELVSHA